MQIVIDIPDEMYKEYVSICLGRGNGKSIVYNLLKVIKNGIPLPKRHGDLKDADRLLDVFFYEYCRYGDFGYRQAENLIKSSLTLIEADGGGKDEVWKRVF